MPRTAKQAQPLPPAVFHLLLALRDGEQHGYALMQRVEELTDGAVRMGPGTLYGAIKRMLADGLIEESDGATRPRARRPTPPLLPDHRGRRARVRGRGAAHGDAAAQHARAAAPRARTRGMTGERVVPRPAVPLPAPLPA